MRESRRIFWTAAALIAVANFIVYAPSLYHKARADQLIYLAEVANLDSFGDILNYTLSYTRHRILLTGDELYFRPLLYLGLALGRYFFKYNFFYWQLTGILIHVTLCIVLMRLLLRIDPHRWLAPAAALWFSLLYLPSEIVIWHHINMYMVCFILILLALSRMVRLIRGESAHVWLPVLYLTLAAFINEFALFACVIFFIVVTRQRKRVPMNPWLFAVPFAAYCALNLLDYLRFFPPAHLLAPFLKSGPGFSLWTTLVDFGAVLFFAVFYPFLPAFFTMIPDERSFLKFLPEHSFGAYFHQAYALIVPNILLYGLCVYLMILLFLNRRSLAAEDDPARRFVFSCSLGLALCYAFLFPAVRSHFQFFQYMTIATYHFYPICLFLTVCAYMLLRRYLRCIPTDRARGRKAMVWIFVLSVWLNATQLYGFNMTVKRKFYPWVRFIKFTENFVQAHAQEPDFSIRFNNRQRQHQKEIDFQAGYPSDATRFNAFPSDLLYRQYIDRDDPKYDLYFEGRAVQRR